MKFLPNILFAILLAGGLFLFVRNVRKLIRNIRLGRPENRSDQPAKRLKYMALVALGQSKMITRPVAGLLHIVVYVGFLFINLELIEIVLDGLLGTHRLFAPLLGSFYNILIAGFEVFALVVILAVLVFWLRRNALKIKRFWSAEMTSWPKHDANLILYIEVVLMVLFLSMNAADSLLQHRALDTYPVAGSFPISQFIAPLMADFSTNMLVVFERTFWWLHIIGILFFLNYLYYSKHLHIILAFPNTYFANLNPKGAFSNMDAVTHEVKLMMDPTVDPNSSSGTSEVAKFGASDVMDLSWIQLLNAYSCTECGRCTSVCPANQTGKKLSPRKVMMDTRDRLEEVGKNIDLNHGNFRDDDKKLLGNHISSEELWACTTCQACIEACPIGIDPMSIILDMRRFLVMEQSAAPSELNNMMNNIENNGAPWPFNQQDRLNWKNEILS